MPSLVTRSVSLNNALIREFLPRLVTGTRKEWRSRADEGPRVAFAIGRRVAEAPLRGRHVTRRHTGMAIVSSVNVFER